MTDFDQKKQGVHEQWNASSQVFKGITYEQHKAEIADKDKRIRELETTADRNEIELLRKELNAVKKLQMDEKASYQKNLKELKARTNVESKRKIKPTKDHIEKNFMSPIESYTINNSANGMDVAHLPHSADEMDFAQLVRNWRIGASLTQVDLANLIGVTQNELSIIENGRRDQLPRLELLIKIANACGHKLKIVVD